MPFIFLYPLTSYIKKHFSLYKYFTAVLVASCACDFYIKHKLTHAHTQICMHNIYIYATCLKEYIQKEYIVNKA